jgi:hypothetical protein
LQQLVIRHCGEFRRADQIGGKLGETGLPGDLGLGAQCIRADLNISRISPAWAAASSVISASLRPLAARRSSCFPRGYDRVMSAPFLSVPPP